jgi:Protein of unknown function (DUF1236)
MRSCLRHGAFVLALLGSASLAGAQDKPGQAAQTPTASGPAESAQQSKSGQAGTQEPSTASGSPAAGMPAPVAAPPGPPGATGQTMPSTRSAENAAEDKRIIVEHALNLSDEQKQKIGQMMAIQTGETTGAGSGGSEALTIGNTVPASVTMHDFPQGVGDQMPEIQKYKYVQMSGKLLIVEPNNRIVVGAIEK